MIGRFLVIFTFCFVYGLDIFAQPLANVRISYEANWTNFRANSSGPVLEGDSVVFSDIKALDNAGFGIGVDADIQFAKRFIFSTGFGYSERNVGNETVAVRDDTSTSQLFIYRSFSDFQLPILIKYLPLNRNNFRIDLQAGTILGFRIKDETTTIDYYEDPPLERTTETSFNNPGPERIFVYGGIGLSYAILGKYVLSMEPGIRLNAKQNNDSEFMTFGIKFGIGYSFQ